MATGKITNPNGVKIENLNFTTTSIPAGGTVRLTAAVPTSDNYEALGIIGLAGLQTCYIMTHYLDKGSGEVKMDVHNYGGSAVNITPVAVVLYRKK